MASILVLNVFRWHSGLSECHLNIAQELMPYAYHTRMDAICISSSQTCDSKFFIGDHIEKNEVNRTTLREVMRI